MTNSRSSISINRLLVVVATLLLCLGTANAERRRVVVLEFEGPKAEKFHEDLVKLLKKSHTVISVEKWNTAAEELDAGKVTEKNVKKIAKKLKVDGVITGKIEKRRDEYIIRLKLRAGTSGELTGNAVQTKAEGPRLDGQAQRDIKEELVGAIDELEANRGGGGDEEEEEAPKKKKKGSEEEEEEESPKKSGFGGKKGKVEEEEEEEEAKPVKKSKKEIEAEEKAAKKAKKEEEKRLAEEEKAALATKKSKKVEEEEEEEPMSKRRPKSSEDEEGEEKTADAGDEDDVKDEDKVEESSDEDTADTAAKLSPSQRAIDAVAGLSFTRRTLQFAYASDLANVPPGYKQTIPVAGALLDVTAYPLAFGHKNKSIYSGIGISVLYDRVLLINSQKRYADGNGMQQVADLKTEESRYALGAVFRYPLGTGPKAIVVGGGLTYGRQKFSVEQTLPNAAPTDIPNVHYTMFTPHAFVHYPATDKIIANADLAFHAITNTGGIQLPTQYGAAKVLGYEINLGADYMLMKNIFVRASLRYESIGLTFNGDPMSKTHTRDADAEKDVSGAKDVYLGGTATVGYLY